MDISGLVAGTSALIIILTIGGIFVSLAFTILMIFVIRKWVKGAFGPNEKLLKEGVAANATILKIWDTGVTLNDNPQVGMLLEVQPIGSEPFRVEMKSIISRIALPQVQPGHVVPVRYDPANPSNVALAF
ncbi:MAG: DUF3592 domain-containing protein [Candidatus Promineifilaceae bacterium]